MDYIKGKIRNKDPRKDNRFHPTIKNRAEVKEAERQQSSNDASARLEQERQRQHYGQHSEQWNPAHNPVNNTPSVHQSVSLTSSSPNGHIYHIKNGRVEYEPEQPPMRHNDGNGGSAARNVYDDYRENNTGDNAHDLLPQAPVNGRRDNRNEQSEMSNVDGSVMQQPPRASGQSASRAFDVNGNLRRTMEGRLFIDGTPQSEDGGNSYATNSPQHVVDELQSGQRSRDYDTTENNLSAGGHNVYPEQTDVFPGYQLDAMEEARNSYKQRNDTSAMAPYETRVLEAPPRSQNVSTYVPPQPLPPRKPPLNDVALPKESSVKRIKSELIEYLSRYYPGVLQDSRNQSSSAPSGYPIVDDIAQMFKQKILSIQEEKSRLKEEFQRKEVALNETKDRYDTLLAQFKSLEFSLTNEQNSHQLSCANWKAHAESLATEKDKLERQQKTLISDKDRWKSHAEGVTGERDRWKGQYEMAVRDKETVQDKFDQHKKTNAAQLSEWQTANTDLVRRLDIIEGEQKSIEDGHKSEIRRMTDYQERREEELNEDKRSELARLESKHADKMAKAKEKHDHKYQELDGKSKKRIRELEADIKEVEDEAEEKVRKAVADCEYKIQRLEQALEDKERQTRKECENEIKHLNGELEGLSSALISQESKYLAPNMSVELLRLDDGDVGASYVELVTLVDSLANLPWKSEQDAWTDDLMRRMGVDEEAKLRLMRKRILKDIIWTHMHQRVFSSPFRAFGKEGGVLEKQWNEAYGTSSDPRLKTKQYAWPAPSIEAERWRYVTMKECRASIFIEHSRFDPRGLAKRDFTENSKALASQLTTSLREIAVLDDAKTVSVMQLIVKVTQVWLKHAMQRYRILVSVNGARCIPASEKARKFEEGSVDLVVVPELGRYGDASGIHLDQYTVITGYKADMYSVSSLRAA